MSPLIPQVPNLNGSSRTSIISSYCDIMSKLRDTIEVLQKNRPHGRDYPYVSATVVTASIAWEERIRALKTMLDEMEACALAVHQAEGGRL